MSLGALLASSPTDKVRGAGAELEEEGEAHTPPVSGSWAMDWNSDQLGLVLMSDCNKIPVPGQT